MKRERVCERSSEVVHIDWVTMFFVGWGAELIRWLGKTETVHFRRCISSLGTSSLHARDNVNITVREACGSIEVTRTWRSIGKHIHFTA